MPISRRRIEVGVGLFMLIGLAAMLLSVIFIGQQRRVFEARFRLYTDFRTVEGLQPGAPVHVAGIQVGTVETVRFTPTGRVQVAMELRESVLDRIHEDSKAHIKSAGLVGDRYIDITVGSQSAATIEPGGHITGVEPLDFNRVLQEARPVIDNLTTVIQNIREVTGRLVEEDNDITQMLENLREITATLREGRGTIGRLLQEEEVYEEMRATLTASRQAATNAQEATAVARDRLPGLLDEAGGAVESFRAAADRVDTGLENLPEVMNSLERTVGDLERAMANLREASEDIKEASPQVPELIASGQAVVDEARVVLDAARAHPLLRRYFEEEQLGDPILLQDRTGVDEAS